MPRLAQRLFKGRQVDSADRPTRLFRLSNYLRLHLIVVASLTASVLIVAMWMGTRVRAASFTSTQSGSWGNAATWGGAGIPSASDDVTISSGTTVTLDANRSSNNLTIQTSATLDLASRTLQLNNSGSALSNSGSMSNSGATNASFVFVGNGTPGSVIQNWAGAGSYASNVQLELSSAVRVDTTATTALNGAVNLLINPQTLLQLVNGLTITGPSAPSPTFANLTNNGSIGGNALHTQGNVQFNGSGTYGVTLEVDGGTVRSASLIFGAGKTFQIDSGAALDLNGQSFSLQGPSITFNNLGTVSNSGAAASFVFVGNGTPGSVIQNWAGAGSYASNVQLELSSAVRVDTTATTALNGAVNLLINPQTLLQLVNGLTITGPSAPSPTFANLTNNGSIGGNALHTQGNVRFSGSGTYGVTLEVDGGTVRSASLIFGAGKTFQIDSGGALDLNGQSFSLQGPSITFNNLGTVSNSGTAASFVFVGNGTPGSVIQNWAGAGSYASNVQLELSSAVRVDTTATTALNGAVNLLINPQTLLQLVNGLTIAGPSAPSPTFANLTNNGSIGGNALHTQGNVQFNGSGTYGVTLEVDGGTVRSASLIFGAGKTFQIDSGAALDLNGQSFSLQGPSITFNNLGTVSNSGAAASFVFVGNGTPGSVIQNWAGAGSYASNVQLELSSAVRVDTTATTALNGAVNLLINPQTLLQLVNGLTITGPSAPSPTFANLTNNGSIGGNALHTQGNVQIIGSGIFDVSLEVDGGTLRALAMNFTSGRTFQIDVGGTLDLNGQAFSFLGNNTTFINLGSVSNSGGATSFFFNGNGTPGSIAQTFGGGGSYASNVTLWLNNAATVFTTPTTALSGAINLKIDPLSTLVLNNGLLVTGPSAPSPTFANITNNGSISGNALRTQGNVQFSGSGTYGAPLEVESGITRGNNFNFTGGATLIIDSGGTLAEANSITGSVNNSGTLRLNPSPTCLNITGNYSQTATGLLDLKIGGLGACSQYTRLIIGGSATLAGTIKETLVNFSPNLNDSFQVLSFASRSGTFAVINGSFTANYAATSVSLVAQTGNFNITGKVLNESAVAVAGVTITLAGASSATTTTDASGNYSFSNLATGDYTVTASASGLSFSPASFNFTGLNSNRIGNFVAKQTLVAINGNVVDENNIVMSNVVVSLVKTGSPAATTQTNVVGNYSFDNLEAGANYVVTPTGSFIPSNQTFNNLAANVVANFKSSPAVSTQCSTVTFARTDFAVAVTPFAAVTGDFNGDGKIDIVVSNLTPGNVSLLLGTGTGSFNTPTNFSVGSGAYTLSSGDFNNDSKLDLAVANGNRVSILLGTGTGSFSGATNFAVGNFPRSIAVGDFNSDGKQDLAVGDQTSGSVSVLFGDGTGGFGAPTTLPTGASATSVTAGDFNNDGKLDLAVANFGPDNVSILLGNGNGGFSAATNFSVGTDPFFVRAIDFNGDGKVDLAVPNVNGNNVSILLGTGTGSFGAATNFGVGAGPTSVVIGDFNGDGKSDLATANNGSDDVSILLGTGTGSFAAAANLAAGTNPRPLTSGDFDSDGKTDLVVPNENSNNVSVLLNTTTTCNTQTSVTISGNVTAANSSPLPQVVVTLSGPITRVTESDSNGNYSFANLAPGGNYSITLQSPYFVFAPSRADFFNLSSSQVANFRAAPLAVPSPTPTPDDDFGNAARDATKWTIGAQTSATTAFDPLVTTAQTNGQLVVTPLSQVSGMHFAGYVSANSFDLRNGSAKVEVVKAGTGGVDTVFAVGTDVDNFYRFMVHTPGTATTLAPRALGRDGIEHPLDTSVAQLVFQVNVGGQLTSLAINYDPVQHRFMRFRHVPSMNSIVFETSPDNIMFTVQHTVVLQRSVAALTAELSAGTTNPTNPSQTVFDNFGLITSTFQFSAPSYSIGEGDGSILVTVTRAGSLTDAATVDFATADGTARQRSKYTNSAGTLTFAAGIASRTFRVLLVDNQLAEGDQSLNLLLSNPNGAGLNTPGRAVLTISDNDTTLATGSPLDDAQYFVTQHYYDFLNRVPDQGGLDFWKGQITQCGTDVQCLRTQRITVSNAFFYEQEYQQTGSYVVRLYRAAFGNNQPISNNDNNPNFPNENKKLVNYSVFSTDRARVRGGPSLAQTQLDLANAFVLRSQFVAKYPSTLNGSAYVDTLIANINADSGVDLSSQRTALIDLFNSSGRGAVLYRIADDNTQTNPINNRAFIDAEYNRSFVLTQYFGYLRRNPDIGGYLFWLGQVNSAPLRALEKQRAMVCSFITSLEYQQRFSPVATHNNTECQ